MSGNKKGKSKATETSSQSRSYAPPTYHVSSPPYTTSDMPSPASALPIDRPVSTPSSDASGRASRRTQKLFVTPRGLEFTNNHQAVAILNEEMLKKYSEAWTSWTEIPQLHRDMIFNEFAKRVEWLDVDTYAMKKAFDHKASDSLSDKLFYARRKGKKPKWMSNVIWSQLQEAWASEKYQKKSSTNKQNRASDCSGQGYPLHKGGSISHLEHKDRLEAQLGRPVGLAESFKHTHSSLNKETGEIRWVDDRARNTYSEFENRWNDLSSQNSNPVGEHGQDEEGSHQSTMPNEIQVCMDTVARPKKRRMYGVPGHHVSIASSSSWTESSGMHNQQLLTRIDAQQQEIHAQQQEIHAQAQKLYNVEVENEGLKNRLSSIEGKLEQVLSMSHFFSSTFPNMQAPTPPGTQFPPPAYNIRPPTYNFVSSLELFPPFPNVSSLGGSSSPTNEDNDDD